MKTSQQCIDEIQVYINQVNKLCSEVDKTLSLSKEQTRVKRLKRRKLKQRQGNVENEHILHII